MTVSIIAAVGKNNEIGKNGGLICHLKGDLPFFKRVTMGKPVIMGRKTFESLPGALPGRTNIVISSKPDYKAEGAAVVRSLEDALAAAKNTAADEIFIIGGGRVYADALPLADRLYLTEAEFTDDGADTFFPVFDKTKWQKEILDTCDGEIPYKHILYKK